MIFFSKRVKYSKVTLVPMTRSRCAADLFLKIRFYFNEIPLFVAFCERSHKIEHIRTTPHAIHAERERFALAGNVREFMVCARLAQIPIAI